MPVTEVCAAPSAAWKTLRLNWSSSARRAQFPFAADLPRVIACWELLQLVVGLFTDYSCLSNRWLKS
jgi:hypothetical protein